MKFLSKTNNLSGSNGPISHLLKLGQRQIRHSYGGRVEEIREAVSGSERALEVAIGRSGKLQHKLFQIHGALCSPARAATRSVRFASLISQCDRLIENAGPIALNNKPHRRRLGGKVQRPSVRR